MAEAVGGKLTYSTYYTTQKHISSHWRPCTCMYMHRCDVTAVGFCAEKPTLRCLDAKLRDVWQVFFIEINNWVQRLIVRYSLNLFLLQCTFGNNFMNFTHLSHLHAYTADRARYFFSTVHTMAEKHTHLIASVVYFCLRVLLFGAPRRSSARLKSLLYLANLFIY